MTMGLNALPFYTVSSITNYPLEIANFIPLDDCKVIGFDVDVPLSSMVNNCPLFTSDMPASDENLSVYVPLRVGKIGVAAVLCDAEYAELDTISIAVLLLTLMPEFEFTKMGTSVCYDFVSDNTN